MELFAAHVKGGSVGINDRQAFHRYDWLDFLGLGIRCPTVVMEDKPAQREHRLRGVAKQHDYRRSEPISPAGNLVGAPKGIAVTLHRTPQPPRKLTGSRAQGAIKVRGGLSWGDGVRVRENGYDICSFALGDQERQGVYGIEAVSEAVWISVQNFIFSLPGRGPFVVSG